MKANEGSCLATQRPQDAATPVPARPAQGGDNESRCGGCFLQLPSVFIQSPFQFLLISPPPPLLSLLQATNTMSFAALATVALGVLVLYVIKALFTRKRPAGPLPPGPRPKPILGNISDLPPPGAQDWVHWMKHNDLYGTHAIAQHMLGVVRF